VLNPSVFEFPTGRSIFAEGQPFQYEFADELPNVPALPETLLAMDLQLRSCPVDLCGVADAVLADLGATLQILRLAGREYGNADDRPTRIEDCICDLGLNACLEAAANGIVRRAPYSQAIVELWTHSREIAQYCRLLAELELGAFRPQEAYLAGLLHGIGALPEILGWDRCEFPSDPARAARRMAERWRFPAFLKDFFREACMPGNRSRWARLLDDAHQLTMDSWAHCPLGDAGLPAAAVLHC